MYSSSEAEAREADSQYSIQVSARNGASVHRSIDQHSHAQQGPGLQPELERHSLSYSDLPSANNTHQSVFVNPRFAGVTWQLPSPCLPRCDPFRSIALATPQRSFWFHHYDQSGRSALFHETVEIVHFRLVHDASSDHDIHTSSCATFLDAAHVNPPPADASQMKPTGTEHHRYPYSSLPDQLPAGDMIRLAHYPSCSP